MAGMQSDQSVFNMAMAYLQRIDRLLYKCQEAAHSGNIDAWLNCLYGIRREVSVKLKDTEPEELKGMFSEVVKLLTPADRIKKRAEILNKLDEIDIYMRLKLQERGMLLPNRSDPRFAILER